MFRKWKGKFTSTCYKKVFGIFPVVAGEINTFLPNKIEDVSDVVIKLQYTGIYKYLRKAFFVVNYIKGDNQAYEYLTNESTSTARSGQTIRFLIIEKSDTEIKGRYFTYMPNDSGNFSLSLI